MHTHYHIENTCKHAHKHIQKENYNTDLKISSLGSNCLLIPALL